MSSTTLAGDWRALLARAVPFAVTGQVARLSGLAVWVSDFPVPLGARCAIARAGLPDLRAEVVGFQDQSAILLAEAELDGVRRGAKVRLTQSAPTATVGEELLGRVLDASGRPLDGRSGPASSQRRSLHGSATSALDRPRIDTHLVTGVRAIDALVTCGVGQRLGIFAGTGVGKSVLLGQLARGSSADVNVVVLIGERGREVREFIDDNLGPAGLARSVVVCATSDESPLLRRRAALLGASLAEAFRDRGRNVLLLVDSITRLALAQREIGLAAGEPPTTRGFPPSVFALLPRVLERSGRTRTGSITGLYTVLVEGDDPHDPIADAIRGTLDGHLILSRRLAELGHFPALDVLASLSRVMPDLVEPAHLREATQIRRVLAAVKQAEDLVAIGAYQPGSQKVVDVGLAQQAALAAFLCQARDETTDWPTLRARLAELARRCEC